MPVTLRLTLRALQFYPDPLASVPGGGGRFQLNQPLPVSLQPTSGRPSAGERHPHEDAGQDRGQDVGDCLDADEAKGAL